MKMKKTLRIIGIVTAAALAIYMVCCTAFCAYAKPIVTRYGYAPHHWNEYFIGSIRFRKDHREYREKRPFVFVGLKLFRPALIMSAELGLIPIDKRQA